MPFKSLLEYRIFSYNCTDGVYWLKFETIYT